jgi:hypothetical protein
LAGDSALYRIEVAGTTQLEDAIGRLWMDVLGLSPGIPGRRLEDTLKWMLPTEGT